MAPRGSVLEDATNQEELIRTPGGSAKTVEETYQKKTQLEHILLRPDTYIGSVEKVQQTLWVFDGTKMVQKEVGYVPGLYKIFDEILVNAADNKVRDSKMDTLRVDIDQETNTVKVFNNGNGVPVTVHKEEGVHVPELIFGHLLTSSNYNDQEKKVTGGRNGYGAKLTNIFSTEFTIETCDGQRGLQYKQTFRNNMASKGEPAITKCKKTDNWTCVTFKPDLEKFNMNELEDDIVALMTKRVYDVAGCIGRGCKVYLNGEQLKIKKFSDYVDFFLNSQDVPKIHEKVNDRWEICVTVSDGQFQQCSFVNSINTLRGGTHVNHIADQVSAKILEHMKKKHKNTKIKPFQIKNHLWIFVNSLIENPAFDSQTKETLTTRASAFGSKCDLSDDFMKKVFKCGVIDNILAWATFKESKELKKTDGSKRSRLVGIPKLDDANDAGTRNSQHCTLILTEGDSAKALAISGLSVVGRDRFGVFPLRGKLLNVRDASHQQIMSNAEISNIKQILGLQHGKEYTDTKALRYGHLMIMTDQDHDGSHIKGLLINFLHAHFSTLLKVPGFLVEFITPIIKAKKGKQTVTFYSMPEYQKWLESLGEDRTKGWSIKYYKGLGTSTAAEAKQYFADIENHRKVFSWDGSIVKNPAKKNGESGYTIKGRVTQIDDTTLEITELPIRKWTQDYKEFLETLVKPENKNEQPFITDYKEYHTDTSVHFIVTLPAEKMQEALSIGLEKKFKLTTTVSTSNMHLFNADGLITKYASAEEILSDFYGMRLELYEKRKAYLLASMEQDMLRLDNKVRFILAVVSGNLLINNRKKADIESELETQGYDKMRKRAKGKKLEDNDEEDSSAKSLHASYDYLLSMPLWSLTMEKVSELCGERDKHAGDLELLRATSPKEMWNQDLDAFLTELDRLEAEEETDAKKLTSQRNTARRQQQKQSKKQKGKQKKANPWSDEGSDGLDGEEVIPPRTNKTPQVASAAPRQRVAYKKNAGTVSMNITEEDTATAATVVEEEPAARRRVAPAVPKPIMSVNSETPRRQAPARARKPRQKIYDISSDEEEEEDDDFDLEEEEDSDFEV
eukprot:jgi/Pico_ML_1/51117/g2201.t2